MGRSSNIPASRDIAALLSFLTTNPRLVVLTGAGCSVGSGIPTYRDGNGVWQRSEPIYHQDFVTTQSARQRYWLRSYVGWPAVARAIPTSSHHALARMEQLGLIDLLVTQNVDRLHQKARSRRVVDLHGRLDEVLCLDCGALFSRQHIQNLLKALNPFLTDPHLSQESALAPDGDANVNDHWIDQIEPPGCSHCDGIVKPNVVFFGDNVARGKVDNIYRAIDQCDGLLIVGSSLKVFSGFRFCRYAFETGKSIASINPGITRADELIDLRLRADCDDILPFVTDALLGPLTSVPN